MSGISAMFFGGTSSVFAGAWDFSSGDSFAAGLALGSDGTSPYVVLGGYTTASGSGSEGRVFRVNTDRTTAWTRSVDVSFSSGARASALTLDTSYNTFFANNTENNSGTNLGPVLVKTDTAGAVSWQRKFSTGTSPDLTATAVATDSSGNVYMAGYYSVTRGGFLVKYNSSGTLQWQRTLTSTDQCTIQSIAVDGSGNVIVAGYYQFTYANLYAHITKYNSSGTLQWQKYVNQTATSYTANIPAMVCDSSDNIYFYMSVRNIITDGKYNYYVKLDSTGAMQWTRRTDNDDDYSTGGAYIDADGYIYFVAYHGVSTNGTYIVKYNSSGTRQFDRKLTNVTNPRGIVVDTAGFMWVQGDTTDGGLIDYMFLTRLPSDGPGSITFSLPTPDGPISVVVSTPALTENTTALTIATSSLTDAAGTYTDSAGALTTSTFSTTAYTAP